MTPETTDTEVGGAVAPGDEQASTPPVPDAQDPTPATPATPATPPTPPTPPKPSLSLGKRLLLLTGSLALTFLGLELAARLWIAPPAPVMVRDGVYVTQLPKVNGRDTIFQASGPPMLEKKQKDEVRFFVFGESSVQGVPWQYPGSPVTMLHDHLQKLFPNKRITTVSMGRGGGFTIDSFYFLLSIGRFAPDYVIFYQGGNDEYRTDRETCMPSQHPYLYRAWARMAQHSRLLWAVRALGPYYFIKWRKTGRGIASDDPKAVAFRLDGREGFCKDPPAFGGWANTLIETAQHLGAKVIVTTPVQSRLRWLEDGAAREDKNLDVQIKSRNDGYQRLLACQLDFNCDMVKVWKSLTEAPKPDYWITPRGQAWKTSAEAHGVRAIDFNGYLNEHLQGGLGRGTFIDEMHLSLEGYWLLSWLWAREVASLEDGRALGLAPPPVDRARYVNDVVQIRRSGEACLLLPYANLYLRGNMPLVATLMLNDAVAAEVHAPGALAETRAGLMAQLVSGWMRKELGLDPALPPSLAAKLPGLSLKQLTLDIAADNDRCSKVGAGLLDDLVAANGGDKQEVAHEPPPGSQNDLFNKNLPSVFAIQPGQEQVVLAMLKGSVGGCKLDGVEIQKTYLVGTWLCEDGAKRQVELHHPTDLDSARLAATTKRFALHRAPGVGSLPSKFVSEVRTSVESNESSFVWTERNAPRTAGAPVRARPKAKSRRYLWAALAVAVLGAIWLRRRKPRDRVGLG